LRASLEASLVGLGESHSLNIWKLTKDRDHALALEKVLKNKKYEFDVSHAGLLVDLEKLEKAHKDLESRFSSLTKSKSLSEFWSSHISL
jgi:hypothetical protein